jgi:hypothetical protein
MMPAVITLAQAETLPGSPETRSALSTFIERALAVSSSGYPMFII